MFRITEQHGESRVVLKLEGRFSAGVVSELDACWRAVTQDTDDSSIWLDLTDVDRVDRAAEEQLARMHRAGVRFLTRGCFMNELVREIARCEESDSVLS